MTYAQKLVEELRERADGYRQSGPSAEHTADLLEKAAFFIESQPIPGETPLRARASRKLVQAR